MLLRWFHHEDRQDWEEEVARQQLAHQDLQEFQMLLRWFHHEDRQGLQLALLGCHYLGEIVLRLVVQQQLFLGLVAVHMLAVRRLVVQLRLGRQRRLVVQQQLVLGRVAVHMLAGLQLAVQPRLARLLLVARHRLFLGLVAVRRLFVRQLGVRLRLGRPPGRQRRLGPRLRLGRQPLHLN